MKKGEIISKIIVDPKTRAELEKIKDRFLLVLTCAHRECEQDFHKLDGLTWPNGNGILISKSEPQIKNSFASAVTEAIPSTPYFAEVGHSKKDLKRIVEMAFVILKYPPGIRNEVRDFIEPRTTAEMTWKYCRFIEQKNSTEQNAPSDGDKP
jgi:negative regulator of replication initiation